VFACIGGLPFQFLFAWYHFTQMKRELKCLIKIKKREVILVTCFFFKKKKDGKNKNK
jgi:hypothetical protein